MILTGVKEKIRELLNKFSGVFKRPPKEDRDSAQPSAWRGIPAALGKLCTGVPGEFAALVDRFLGHFPEGKRKPILFAFGGLVALLLILVISTVVIHTDGPKKNAPVDISTGPRIPAEELFIPTEPDFLPDFLLEREPRSFWALDDIRPYWKSPGNQELWQEEIKSAVDKLMEGVQ